MRILIIPSWYPTKENPEAGLFIMEQAIALKNHGLDVAYLILEKRKYNCLIPEDLDFDGNDIPVFRFQVLSIPKVNRSMWKYWAKSIIPQMERIINSFGRPDLIHGHSFMAGYAALEISERFEIPFVITEHYQGFNRSIKRRHRRIIQEVFNSANARLAVSDSLKRKLGAYTDRLIQVIPNLVNEKRFVFHARSMTYPIEFIAIGGLSKRKRFQQLITYFLKWKDQYHVDAILTIIGAGETLSHLRKIIEAANAHDHVQLIGHLSRSDLAVALKKAHVLLSLSKSETFGLAVAEGLISGIPAIVTKSGGPEVLINDQNGIVIEEATYKHFSSAMNRMIDNYDKIDHLAIRKTMIDRIGTTVVCERIKGVYEQIIS